MTTSHDRDRILDWLDAVESDYSRMDEDRLASDARRLRSTQPGGIDMAVGAWLAARPSPARVDIASVVLQSLWNPALGTPVLDPDVVGILLAAHGATTVTEEGDATFARALCAAYEAGLPRVVGERALDALAAALRRPNANPAIHPWIRRTLANAGRAM